MEGRVAGPLAYDPELLYMWKVQPSRREGYYRCYSVVTAEGDRLEVDYNHGRSMVHIQLTLEAEHGRQYVSVIKSGTILRERDATSSRPTDLTRRMAPFAPLFSFLRDEGLLRSIGGTYGIPVAPAVVAPPRLFGRALPSLQMPGLLERLRRYLEERRRDEERSRPWRERVLRRLPAELGDACLAGGLLGCGFLGWLGMGELAGYLGFWAILSGAIDWLIRGRSPFLPKVASILVLAAGVVYVQVQYRMWAIFL